MRAEMIALATLLLAGNARAEPVTVWLSDDVPEPKLLEKADLQTDGTLHLWSVDLRFPPTPETPEDQAATDALQAAVEGGEARWEEFEVEYAIATDLAEALDRVTLMRSGRDRSDVVDALMFAGTAAVRAFAPDAFATDPQAEPFRVNFGGVTVPRAWVEAWALSGERAQRGDLPDGTGWADYQRFVGDITALAPARLEVPTGIGQVWIDGAPVDPGLRELRPGRHWVHVVRGDVVHGRVVVDLKPGEQRELPMTVDASEIAATRERVLAGRKSGFPDEVKAALALIEQRYGGPLYLGTADGNKAALVALGAATELKDERLVTVTLFADVGGGVLGTTLFGPEITRDGQVSLEGASGDLGVAGAAIAGLGAELGISYFALALGADAAITPGRTIDYVLEEGRDPASGRFSVFPQPWVGIGGYALRPTKAAATLSILGTVSYLAPASLGYGGRVAVGLPIDAKPTWIRLTLGGSYAPTSFRDVDTRNPMFTGWLKLGFAGR